MRFFILCQANESFLRPKIVWKILISLFDRLQLKIEAIGRSKDDDSLRIDTGSSRPSNKCV